MNPNSETRPLTKAEFDEFNKDMEALLNKHNCEIGVVSTIQILKRVTEDVPSPFMEKDNGPEGTTTEEPKA